MCFRCKGETKIHLHLSEAQTVTVKDFDALDHCGERNEFHKETGQCQARFMDHFHPGPFFPTEQYPFKIRNIFFPDSVTLKNRGWLRI